MPILVALLLGMVALAFVLYPLYRSTSGDMVLGKTEKEDQAYPAHGLSSPYASTPAPTNVEDRLDSSRQALQEVELDYQLGNLSEADYRMLHERYMRRALVAMKTRHDLEQELDDAIEEQLRLMKEQEKHATE